MSLKVLKIVQIGEKRNTLFILGSLYLYLGPFFWDTLYIHRILLQSFLLYISIKHHRIFLLSLCLSEQFQLGETKGRPSVWKPECQEMSSNSLNNVYNRETFSLHFCILYLLFEADFSYFSIESFSKRGPEPTTNTEV